jgi:hypothetical protein
MRAIVGNLIDLMNAPAHLFLDGMPAALALGHEQPPFGGSCAPSWHATTAGT